MNRTEAKIIADMSKLILDNPLALVKYDDSVRNRRCIRAALKKIRAQRKGRERLCQTKNYLMDISSQYQLRPNEAGVRAFLIKEIDTCERSFFSGLGHWLGLSA